MVEDCNFIRASLLLLAGRKQNVDLLLFLLCVCVFCSLEKSLSILGSGLRSLVGAQSLAIMLIFRDSFLGQNFFLPSFEQ